LLGLVLLGLIVGGTALWWVQHPMKQGADLIDLSIERGESARDVARKTAAAGVQVPPDLLYAYFRLSGRSRVLKAGSYEIPRGSSPEYLLDMLAEGRQAVRSVTLVEGWTFRQFREALARADHLKQDTTGLSGPEIMTRLDHDGIAPEGRFFPDTYVYPKNSSDLGVLRQALQAMDRRLEAAWSVRAPDLPLQSPEQALILASIVEKETGLQADRGQIAGVFANRLRIGMPLQTDPTVIYGASEAQGVAFEGRLRRIHLDTDTPWNTYTRPGLPPTPIAMPGNAALMAAVKPEATSALYFVSRGDGSSHFSPNLGEHNRAVDQYIRKK